MADVVAALRSARAGQTLLPRSVIVGIAQRVAGARDRQPERPPMEPLTARELDVMRAVADGLSTQDICDRLVISRNTLRTHVQNIMSRLDVHSKLEAGTVALRYRIIEPPPAEGPIY
ncbi:MAG: response regulator transcription factor [Chloroflexi bacterium]|nr:response regulator transcription factor [Chloroflexota bacterium]